MLDAGPSTESAEVVGVVYSTPSYLLPFSLLVYLFFLSIPKKLMPKAYLTHSYFLIEALTWATVVSPRKDIGAEKSPRLPIWSKLKSIVADRTIPHGDEI